jgi:hypothetical protein
MVCREKLMLVELIARGFRQSMTTGRGLAPGLNRLLPIHDGQRTRRWSTGQKTRAAAGQAA